MIGKIATEMILMGDYEQDDIFYENPDYETLEVWNEYGKHIKRGEEGIYSKTRRELVFHIRQTTIIILILAMS